MIILIKIYNRTCFYYKLFISKYNFILKKFDNNFVGFLYYEKNIFKIIGIQWIQIYKMTIEEVFKLFILTKNKVDYIDNNSIQYRKNSIYYVIIHFEPKILL